MFGNWLLKLLTLTLILCCLFGCGSNDVTTPNNGNPVSTITIEKIRGEKVEVVEKIESGLPTIVNGVLIGFHSKIIATYAEKISWRLNADPAPKTDLVVKVNIGFTDLPRYIPGNNPKDYHWAVIPKFQNKSEEFSDTVSAGVIKIHPLPMIFIDGEGLIVDSEKLQEDLPDESRGGHRIPEDFDFPLYKVGDSSEILCEHCGEIIDIIIPESKLDNVDPLPATTVKVTPAPGAVIPLNQQIWLYFDEPVTEVMVNGASTSVTGIFDSKIASFWMVSPALGEGLVMLNIEWTNRNGTTGSQRVGPYIVNAPDVIPPLITNGTVADGETGVNPVLINASGLRYDFDEPITGTIILTDEAGADLNWIANVAGKTATLTPVAGQELVNETTYKIEIDVQDGVGNPLQTTITFVTKPK